MPKNKSYALIIYSGEKNSLEDEMLKETIETLKAKGQEYKLVDLKADKFDYVFRGRDLAQYSRATTTKEQVMEYQKLTKEAEDMIFIYESKWNGMDKFVKGFFDQVFLSDGFWKPKNMGLFVALWGTTTWIRKWVVLTHQKNMTYQILGDPAKAQIMRGTINALTMDALVLGKPKKKYLGIENSSQLKNSEKEIFFKKLRKAIQK